MRFTKTRIALATIAVVASVGVICEGGAEAVTPSQTVSATRAGGPLSWRTPAVRSAHAVITNTTTTNTAASVITLKDSSAPTSYDFPVTLASNESLVSTSDGGFDVVASGSGVAVAVGHIEMPWAKDVTGKALPTSFTLKGFTLTQHVNVRGAKYPITADPKYTSGWVTGTIYFRKSETKTISSSLGTATVLCGAAAAVIGGPVLAAACGVVAVQMNVQARNATARGQCIKIKYSKYPSPVYAGTYVYSRGYCT